MECNLVLQDGTKLERTRKCDECCWPCVEARIQEDTNVRDWQIGARGSLQLNHIVEVVIVIVVLVLLVLVLFRLRARLPGTYALLLPLIPTTALGSVSLRLVVIVIHQVRPIVLVENVLCCLRN